MSNHEFVNELVTLNLSKFDLHGNETSKKPLPVVPTTNTTNVNNNAF